MSTTRKANEAPVGSRVDYLFVRLLRQCLCFVFPVLCGLLPIGIAHIVSFRVDDPIRLAFPAIFVINTILLGMVSSAILRKSVWPNDAGHSLLDSLRGFLDALGLGGAPLINSFFSRKVVVALLVLMALPGPLGLTSWCIGILAASVVSGEHQKRFHNTSLALLLGGIVLAVLGFALDIGWQWLGFGIASATIFTSVAQGLVAPQTQSGAQPAAEPVPESGAKRQQNSFRWILLILAVAPGGAAFMTGPKVFWWIGAIAAIPWVILFFVQDEIPKILKLLETTLKNGFNAACVAPVETLYAAQDVVRYSDGYYRRCVARFSQLMIKNGGATVRAGEYGYCAQVGGSEAEKLGTLARSYIIRDAATFWKDDQTMAKWVKLIQSTIPAHPRLTELSERVEAALCPPMTLVLNHAEEHTILKFPWLREEMVVLPDSVVLRWDYPAGSGIYDYAGDPCYVNDVEVRISLSQECKTRLEANDRAWACQLINILPLVMPSVYESILSSIITQSRRIVVEKLLVNPSLVIWPNTERIEDSKVPQELSRNVSNALAVSLPEAISVAFNVEIIKLSVPQTYVLGVAQRRALTSYEAEQSRKETAKREIRSNILQQIDKNFRASAGLINIQFEDGGSFMVWNALQNMLRKQQGVLSEKIQAGFSRLNQAVSSITNPNMQAGVPDARKKLDAEVEGYEDGLQPGVQSMIDALDRIRAAFRTHDQNEAP